MHGNKTEKSGTAEDVKRACLRWIFRNKKQDEVTELWRNNSWTMLLFVSNPFFGLIGRVYILPYLLGLKIFEDKKNFWDVWLAPFHIRYTTVF